MSSRPQASIDDTSYRPEPRIESLNDFLSSPVHAAEFPQHILRFRNDRAATTIGLAGLSDAQWIDHFGRFVPLPNNLPQPRALRYHGHQFRVYNPDIGDGRGFLFAQMRERAQGERLLDLGTKGSGQTPYSRSGDGRLTLKGGVREILATEMLEALGVSTSRTFSLIETGEALERGDEPSPTRGSVLVRLSHSHIRIGSFQRLAALGQTEELARLVDYTLRELLVLDPGTDPAATMMSAAVERCADLAGSYMVAGFVHGVLNSDNINVTSESFDYGPWRFTPRWEPGFTAAYFDRTGLYAFSRQAEAIHWNLAQLAMSLRPLTESEPLIAALERFPALYEASLVRRFLWRLGHVAPDETAAHAFVSAALRALMGSDILIDRFFLAWRRGGHDHPDFAGEAWDAAREAFSALTPVSGHLDHPYWSDEAPCSMHIEEVEALWSAIDRDDDWAPLADKVGAIRRMGAALGAPPRPSFILR